MNTKSTTMASSPPTAKRSKTSHTPSTSPSSMSHHQFAAASPPASHQGVSMSLPLLEGLCQRPVTAHKAVQKALTRIEAAQRIARWILAKKKKQNRGVYAIQQPPTIKVSSHWLWDAMQSASRAERHVAARLLLQGGCPCSTCRSFSTTKNNTTTTTLTAQEEEYRLWQMQSMLRALMNQHILTRTDSILTCPTVPMEWMALLKHLLVGKMVTEERLMAFSVHGIQWMTRSIWQLVAQLAADSTSAAAPTQLQALIAMTELCYSVLMVVFCEPTTEGARKTTAADASSNSQSAATAGQSSPRRANTAASSNSRRNNTNTNIPTSTSNNTSATTTAAASNVDDNGIQSAPVAKRLALRKRILNRLFWKYHTGNVGETDTSAAVAEHNHHHYHATVPPLSPLACLVGALHIWKTNTDWPYPGPTADACLAMLRQLIDPNATPKAVTLPGLTATATATAQATSNANASPSSHRRRRKLSRSFSAGSGASAANNNNSNNNPHMSGFMMEVDEDDDDDEEEDVIMEDLDDDDQSEGGAAAGENNEVEVVVHDEDDQDDNYDPQHEEEIDSDEVSGNGHEQEHDDEEEAVDQNEEGDEAQEEHDHDNQEHDNNIINDNDMSDDDDSDTSGDDIHDNAEGHIVLNDDEVANFEEGFLEINDGDEGMAFELEELVGGGRSGLVMASPSSGARNPYRRSGGGGSGGAGAGGASNRSANNSESSRTSAGVSEEEVAERKQLCLHACMQVLAVQHPPLHPLLASGAGNTSMNRLAGTGSRTPSRSASPAPHLSLMKTMGTPAASLATAGALAGHHQAKCFSLSAEQALLESAMAIVRPPKKPVNIKMIMRRAPTQEEFFRGSLSRNPVSLSMLKPTGSDAAPSTPGEVYEPTVRDLRQHIADDLQMSDSAELLELLVANKILDVKLKLRVVHQVLWKNHLMEHSHTSAGAASGSGSALASFLAGGGGGAPSFFSTGSGLSMMFSSSLGGINVGGRSGGSLIGRGGGQPINADTPLASLPPLVVTYRLAGVDGEATEDTVSQLADPEAPSDEMSPAELEQLMEKEYGNTRVVTEGRGVFVLLRSIEHHIQDVLRRIRRDDISVLIEYGTSKSTKAEGKNVSRKKFKSQEPYPGLTLLRCSAQLPSNRKKLLQARAPTVLLRLLLDVLNALEDPQAKSSTDKKADAGDVESNATAKIIKEVIEALAQDISTTAVAPSKKTGQDAMDEANADETTSTTSSVAAAVEGQDQDATTLSLVLSSLETINLSPPLRNIIAKLLPFLTYGQADLSRELALNFFRHIDVDSLVDDDKEENAEMEEAVAVSKENENISQSRTESSKNTVLMDAFVQASKTLPPNEVCNTLRLELINCGFIRLLANFITKGVPSSPPPWSAALWPSEGSMKGTSTASSNKKRQALIKAWREFFQRQGIKTAFNMLVGICRNHPPTQTYVSQIGEDTDKAAIGSVPFLDACHWMESTSDSASNRVYVRGIGLLAETLLDELMEGNGLVSHKVNTLRRKTRFRKKEIAQERRSKALVNMSSFGRLAGGVTMAESRASGAAADNYRSASSGGGVRGTAASFLAPVLGFFRDSSPGTGDAPARTASAAAASPQSRGNPRNNARNKQGAEKSLAKKPAWMAEMENLEDEEGLLCAVCQEGRTLQPKELLGLYAYVKKVSIPAEQCGARESIDGTTLLRTLPSSMPDSLVGTHAAEHWYPAGKAIGDDLRDQRSALSLSSSISRRNSYFTTTVSAGNAIHFSCHQKARVADRNHPKAPKSEWEGAILRNSRVNCNVILPLVSSRSSDVPLVAVDSALTEYQTAVNNLTGSAPKSMLWTVLHDIRFLMLRMSYGEFLNADCGGGSLSSNTQLLMYQLMMADMFEKDAQVDAPETSQHLRNLSAGFLAACSFVHAQDYKQGSSSIMMRGIADSAPMAGLTCILAHNNRDDYSPASTDPSDAKPHPKRRWVIGKEQFLRGLIICAGRRHALGIETSGCVSARGGGGRSGSRARSSSFTDWEVVDEAGEASNAAAAGASSSTSADGRRADKKRQLKPDIDDFGTSIRPMITLFALLDKLSENFALNMEDTDIEEAASRIVKLLEECQRAKGIRELLETCGADFLDHDAILEGFQKGMMAA